MFSSLPLLGPAVEASVELPDVLDGSDVVPVLGRHLRPLPGRVDGGAGLVLPHLGHLEDDLHVVGGAGAAHPPVEVGPGAGGDEVVVLAGVELQTSRAGAE